MDLVRLISRGSMSSWLSGWGDIIGVPSSLDDVIALESVRWGAAAATNDIIELELVLLIIVLFLLSTSFFVKSGRLLMAVVVFKLVLFSFLFVSF